MLVMPVFESGISTVPDLLAGVDVGLLRAQEELLTRLSHVMSEQAEKSEEDEEVKKEDDGEREEDALAGEVRLAEMKHANSEGEMETPEQAQAEEEDRLPSLQWTIEIDADPESDPDEGIERDEVGREGDPPVDTVGHDVAALSSDLEGGDLAAREHGRESVGEFVAKDVEPHWLGQEEEDQEPRDEPANETEDGCARPLAEGDSGTDEVVERPEFGGHKGQQGQCDEEFQ